MYYSTRGPDLEDSLPHEADIMKPNLVAPRNLYGLLGVLLPLALWCLGKLIHKELFFLLENKT